MNMNRQHSRFLTSFCLAALIVLTPSFADATNYKWVDEWGTTHFTNDQNSIPTGVKSQEVRNSRLSIVSSGNGTASAATIDGRLPPDPGEAGKATLAGIDSDNDGVRDDIQRWIALTYPNSQKTRAALRQNAKVMQEFLLHADDPEMAKKISRRSGRALECLAYVNKDFSDIGTELRAVTLNTYKRSKAYLQADRHLSGMMFSSSGMDNWKKSCVFDPDAMPN